MPTRPDSSHLSLTRLFQHLSAPATLRDLALPAQTMEHLLTIASRGARGLRVLFAGPAGTGKTLAVQALANQLELELWRVDLSAIVSKYIGETEKNLDRVFAAAADTGPILLFDEADAPIRQTYRRQGCARPLRQHRDQLFVAADRAVPGTGDPDQ
jgi:ATP-dependent Clp protease ATP-binding subunit ClpA